MEKMIQEGVKTSVFLGKYGGIDRVTGRIDSLFALAARNERRIATSQLSPEREKRVQTGSMTCR